MRSKTYPLTTLPYLNHQPTAIGGRGDLKNGIMVSSFGRSVRHLTSPTLNMRHPRGSFLYTVCGWADGIRHSGALFLFSYSFFFSFLFTDITLRWGNISDGYLGRVYKVGGSQEFSQRI